MGQEESRDRHRDSQCQQELCSKEEVAGTVPGQRVEVNGNEWEVPLFNISFVYCWMCLMGLAMTGPNRAALADWGVSGSHSRQRSPKQGPPLKSALSCPALIGPDTLMSAQGTWSARLKLTPTPPQSPAFNLPFLDWTNHAKFNSLQPCYGLVRESVLSFTVNYFPQQREQCVLLTPLWLRVDLVYMRADYFYPVL